MHRGILWIVIGVSAGFLSACSQEAESEAQPGLTDGVVAEQSDASDADTAVEEPVGPPVFCSGSTAHRWSLTDETDVDFFPDPLLERPDPSSVTGRRLHITEETARWLPGTPDLVISGIQSMNDLSGYGTVGGILLRFEGGPVTDVPVTEDESMTSLGWQLFDLSGATPERVPFEGRIHEEGQTVVLWPLRPLRLGAEHAFVLTTEALADDGECIAPTEATQDLLYGEDLPEHPNSEETAERSRAALETLDLRPDDVSVLSVFTTHNEPLDWLAIVAEADKETAAWGELEGCTDEDGMEECTVWTTVLDRRTEKGNVSADTAPVENDIPVTVWRPTEGEGPYPVVMFAHGLSSDRSQGKPFAKMLAEMGVAVIAMDAIAHGAHPSAEDEDSFNAALGFLAIDLASLSINPDLLRGNFDQTNLDRRRLLRLALTQTDFDGDGVDDFDPETVGYLGESLGAILGSQFLAASPEVDTVVFSVGGGRLMSIVTDTTELDAYMGIIESLIGSKERFDRLVPLVQHLADPADSALWGAHVLKDRFDDAAPPSVLLQVGIQDEIVSKSAGHMQARSMGLTHVAPVAESVELLPVVDAPLSGNGENGATTQALFQFDRVTFDGEVGPAIHNHTPNSQEGRHQMRVFFESWLNDGVPTVVDPYAVFDTPSL